MLLGCVTCPDAAGNAIPLIYLRFFENLMNRFRPWVGTGGVVLAFLYQIIYYKGGNYQLIIMQINLAKYISIWDFIKLNTYNKMNNL